MRDPVPALAGGGFLLFGGRSQGEENGSALHGKAVVSTTKVSAMRRIDAAFD
jgi:hypothetical protein